MSWVGFLAVGAAIALFLVIGGWLVSAVRARRRRPALRASREFDEAMRPAPRGGS